MQDKSANANRHIVIVGGGTSGWMTAAMIGRQVTEKECRITVVAEQDSGIGVGEATIPSLLRLLRMLGAEEVEFMQACDATWKLGIQFSDWLKPEHDYWHPFGVCGGRIDGRDLYPYWLMEQERPYHSYSLHYAAAVAGKSPHSLTAQSPIAACGAYAFHLNAKKFADWLKQQAISSDVQHIVSHVVKAERNADGNVASVTLSNGEEVSPDFFVDCSGFESVLMRQTLNDAWIDWSSHLLCDRAVAVRTPGSAVIPSHTRSLALSAGWSWQIPLLADRGLGYVYSSSFLSDNDALQQLQSTHQLRNADALTPQFLQMKVGRQTTFWNRNVLAIGLSAGFVEPLESSGLHLAQVGVERFLELFAITGDTQTVQKLYNHEMTTLFDDVMDFVQLHYHLSQREDEFWKAARELPLSSRLQHRLRLFDEMGLIDALQADAFPDTSYYFLLSGNQRFPKRPPAQTLAVDRGRLQFAMQAMQDQNRAALRDLPLHEEVLRHVHSPTLAKAS